jgi:hypothetical protein
MPKKYVVTGQYVTFKTNTTSGPAVLGFYRGAPVPDDAEEAAIKHHLMMGLIEEVPEKAMPAAAPLPGDKPGSTGQGETTLTGKDAEKAAKAAGDNGPKGAGGAAASPAAPASTTSPATAPASQGGKPATGGPAKGKAG